MKAFSRSCCILLFALLGILSGCGGGGDSPSPAGPPAIGLVTLIPADTCTIQNGKDKCSPGRVEWQSKDTAGAVSLKFVSKDAAQTSVPSSFTGPFGSQLVEFPFGSWDVILSDAGGKLDSKPMTAVCGPGVNWVGTCQVPVGNLTGTIASCAIASGSTGCLVGVVWHTSYALKPKLIVVDAANSVITTVTMASGAEAVPIQFGRSTVVLYEGDAELARVVVQAACAPGLTWGFTFFSTKATCHA